MCACGVGRTRVEVSRHAVTGGTEGAAFDVDLHTLRRIRATITDIRYAAAIGSEFATIRADLRALRRVRALVEIIRHAVTVEIGRAAIGEFGSASRRESVCQSV